MKNKIMISICLMLVSTFCFAQKSKPVAELPAKGTLQQTSVSEKSVTDDTAKDKAAAVTEGKKGLNAVNVKHAKQAEPNATAQPASPPESGSTGNIPETKHAINTKGTGATRNK